MGKILKTELRQIYSQPGAPVETASASGAAG
jgi:hypothetical protein